VSPVGAERWLAGQNEHARAWLLVLAAVLAIHVGAHWMPTPDAAIYLSIARGLARGEIQSLGQPGLALPPGYPLLIAPTFLASGRPFLAISLLHWGLAVTLAIAVHRSARRLVPDGALLVAGLVMLDVSLWLAIRQTLSELAFLVFLVGTAAALERAAGAESRADAIRRLPLAFGLLGFTCSIREAAAALLAGFAARLAVEAARRRALPPATAPAALATAMAAAIGAGFAAAEWSAETPLTPLAAHLGAIFDPRTSAAEKLAVGLCLRVSEVGRLLVPGMFKAYGDGWLTPSMLLDVPAFVVAAVGWKRLAASRRADVLVLTAPFYFVLHCFWPIDAGMRYLLPLLPVLAASLWASLESPTLPRRSLMAGVVIAHFLVATAYTVTILGPRERAVDRDWPLVARLAAAIETAPAPVAAGDGVRKPLAVMLAFALDRPVTNAVRIVGFDPQPDWWLARRDRPAPPGFAPWIEEGESALWRRETPGGPRLETERRFAR
jgi:hypothetical protein